MTNNNQIAAGVLRTKKKMKKAVTNKLQTVLPEMKTTLGEKKFARRLKKAVKLLLQGIHSSDVLKKAKKQANANKTASRKKLKTKKVKATRKAKKVKAAVPEMFGK